MSRWHRIIFMACCLAVLGWPASARAETDYGPRPYGPYETQERWGAYHTDAAESEVRYFMVKPRGEKQYPGVFLIYGRPGLDDRLFQELRRMASFGFTIFVSHFQEALLIPIFAPQMDPPETLQLIVDGFDEFLKQPERTPGKVCIYATVRGGYYAVKLAARPEVGCLVGIHAVLTDHSLPEQFDDQTVMEDVRDIKVPTLLMVGSGDVETRAIQSKRVAQYLERKGVPVDLIVYPAATRGFDFRTNGRILADDLAKLDSMYRTVEFMSRNLGGENLLGPSLGTNATAPFPTTVRFPFAGVPRPAAPAQGMAR